MFGKIECKLCRDKVRFAFRHLKIKHVEVLEDEDIKKLNMEKVTIEYFKQIE